LECPAILAGHEPCHPRRVTGPWSILAILGESRDIRTHTCWSVPPSWRVTNLVIPGESRDRDRSSPSWASHRTYAHTPVGVSRHPGGSRTLSSQASHGTVIDPRQSRDHDRSSPSWASHGTYTHTTGVVSRVDRENPPPSLGGFSAGLFQNQEPGGRGTLLKNNSKLLKLDGIVLQVGFFSSGCDLF